MSKHTPGPWLQEKCKRPECSCGLFLITPPMGAEGYLKKEDAHLMASAPELLEVAKRSLQFIIDHYDFEDESLYQKIITHLKDIINLAEGKYE